MNNTQTTAAPELVIRRTFNAPRDRVFDAWTSSDLLRAWFGPPGAKVTETTFDAREGGRYRIVMTMADGEIYGVGGRISEYKRPERLAFSFRWEEDDPNLEHDTFVSIDFVDLGERTEMIFKHERFASDESRGRHNEGWAMLFDQLTGALETASPLHLRGIDLSGYMVKDAARAMAFYRDVFGLEPSMVYPEGRGCEYDLRDGTTFGLWGGGGKVMPFQPSNGILFAVNDLNADVAALAERNIAVKYRSETPNCWLAMIDDSEGNTLTLHQRKVR